MKAIKDCTIIFTVFLLCWWFFFAALAEAITLDDKQYYLEVSYINRSHSYLIVGLNAKYKGKVQCLAMDEYGNIISMASKYIKNENVELYIPRAEEATDVSCKYIK